MLDRQTRGFHARSTDLESAFIDREVRRGDLSTALDSQSPYTRPPHATHRDFLLCVQRGVVLDGNSSVAGRADDQWGDRRTGPFRARATDEDTGFRPGAPNTGILRFEYRATIKHQRASVIDDKTEIGCVCSDHSKRASEPNWHRVNE